MAHQLNAWGEMNIDLEMDNELEDELQIAENLNPQDQGPERRQDDQRAMNEV